MRRRYGANTGARPVARLAGGVLTVATLVAGLGGCTGPATPPSPPATATTPGVGASRAPTPGATAPARPDHVVVVVLENKAANQITSSTAPYLMSLRPDAAVMTASYAVAHPSEPNYLALFSGSTQQITDDRCPLRLGARANLGRQLLDAGLSFVGYSEGLPSVGYDGCSAGLYAAKHSPWTHFSNLPASVNQPESAFPAQFAALPTVAFVIPNLCHDMHNCSIGVGDQWLRDHLGSYAVWARQHNSLLIVTFDEDDTASANHIFTLITGAGVRPGRYAQPVSHYSVLATLEDFYGLPRLGSAAAAQPIAAIRH